MSTIPCGHAAPAPGCHLCRLASTDARYARLWGPYPSPSRRPVRPLPCVHEGDIVQRCLSCGGGESHHVRACAVHGRCTRMPTADRDLKVCWSCDDDPAKRPTVPAGYLTIPQPPPLDISPHSRTAVVTVAAGEAGRELLAVSGPPMRAFAGRVGADFVALDWPGHPAWPISAKFAIPTALDRYERILYADADVLFRPGCVNPLDLCGRDEFGACDELPWHLQPSQRRFGVLAGYERLRRETGLAPAATPPWYFNLGVYVASRAHRHLLAAPDHPIRPYHCGEQDIINARLLAAHLAGEARVRLLDRRCNWQNWTDAGFRHAPADAVLHWSGAGHARSRRVADMRRAAGGVAH